MRDQPYRYALGDEAGGTGFRVGVKKKRGCDALTNEA